jgi:cob(I)alamin adenosyltransferase
MGHRLSRIVTRTGDAGTTGLADGQRVAKNTARIEAMGTVDELNCALGLLLASPGIAEPVHATLLDCQHDLFDLGGELALPGATVIGEAHIQRLEAAIDSCNRDLPPLKEFVLPGGGTTAATCHLTRAICRRAERHGWLLAEKEPVNPLALRYLNRLSDLLFVSARLLARQQGGEVLWQRGRGDPAHD